MYVQESEKEVWILLLELLRVMKKGDCCEGLQAEVGLFFENSYRRGDADGQSCPTTCLLDSGDSINIIEGVKN